MDIKKESIFVVTISHSATPARWYLGYDCDEDRYNLQLSPLDIYVECYMTAEIAKAEVIDHMTEIKDSIKKFLIKEYGEGKINIAIEQLAFIKEKNIIEY